MDYYFYYRAWKNLLLDERIDDYEKSKYLVWNYPVSEEFTKIISAFESVGFFNSNAIAVANVLNYSKKMALIDNAARNKYHTSLNCDLRIVGKEFTPRPYAIAVQDGSPLREEINYV